MIVTVPVRLACTMPASESTVETVGSLDVQRYAAVAGFAAEHLSAETETWRESPG